MGDTKDKTTQVRGHNESKTNAVANIQSKKKPCSKSEPRVTQRMQA
jgi:hypothetical protein